jgi:hypothetical protein
LPNEADALELGWDKFKPFGKIFGTRSFDPYINEERHYNPPQKAFMTSTPPGNAIDPVKGNQAARGKEHPE